MTSLVSILAESGVFTSDFFKRKGWGLIYLECQNERLDPNSWTPIRATSLLLQLDKVAV